MTFIDWGEVEAMKTPIGCTAPRCDKDQFHAKMTVNISTVCKISLLNIVVVTRKKEYEKWHFCYRTLMCLTIFRVTFGHLHESC